jgi:site-specific recombinase XerD
MVDYDLKNKKSRILVEGKKIQRLMPEVFEALKNYWSPKKSGLMFPNEDGGILKYKTIQNMYNSAFKKASLPYTSTHVVRHGGTREVLNLTGDITLSQQHLGNASISATMVYAQRDRKAFDEYTKTLWKKRKKPAGVKQG